MHCSVWAHIYLGHVYLGYLLYQFKMYLKKKHAYDEFPQDINMYSVV